MPLPIIFLLVILFGSFAAGTTLVYIQQSAISCPRPLVLLLRGTKAAGDFVRERLIAHALTCADHVFKLFAWGLALAGIKQVAEAASAAPITWVASALSYLYGFALGQAVMKGTMHLLPARAKNEPWKYGWVLSLSVILGFAAGLFLIHYFGEIFERLLPEFPSSSPSATVQPTVTGTAAVSETSVKSLY